jgi:type II secretory pathway pseudopilin PulG
MKKRPAQTLIEVVMATLIAAITTTAVFSVFLSSFYSSSKADKRDAATMMLRQAQSTLKNYVSVEPGNANIVNGNGTAGSPIIAGAPNGGIWSADSSGTSALAAGTHDISSLLVGTALASTPGFTASFTYTVTDTPCLQTINPLDPAFASTYASCKNVSFQLKYPDTNQ